MRLLHIVDKYLQPTETFIEAYIQKSALFGEVYVATFSGEDISRDNFNSIKILKISERYHSTKNIIGLFKIALGRLLGWRIWQHSLKKIISSVAPDIIHCHFGTMGATMRELTSNYDIPVPFVTSFYGYDASSLPVVDPIYCDNLKKLWISGAGFLIEGPALRLKLINLGCPGNKCYINPLLISIKDYPIKQQYREIGTAIKFLFVGRFVEKKGFHIFLEAVNRINNELGDFNISIVGTGPLQSKYEGLIEEFGLQDRVTWLGLKKHQEVIEMLREFDFLVHPSLTATDGDAEGGAPTIIIEAQAAGLPIITTNHDDIPYVMGYKDFLAKENDVSSLAEAITKLVNCDAINYYVAQGRQHVLKFHDLETNTTYESILKKLAIN